MNLVRLVLNFPQGGAYTADVTAEKAVAVMAIVEKLHEKNQVDNGSQPTAGIPRKYTKRIVKRPYDADEEHQIVTLYNSGKKISQIAKLLKRTTMAVGHKIYVLRKEGRINRYTYNHKRIDAQSEQIEAPSAY